MAVQDELTREVIRLINMLASEIDRLNMEQDTGEIFFQRIEQLKCAIEFLSMIQNGSKL